MARNDDIDWSELVTLGSLIGNLIQADKNLAAKEEIKQREAQVLQLLRDRESLLNSINRFEHGVAQLEQKVQALETMNSNLLKENAKLEAEKAELQTRVSDLEARMQGGAK